MPKQVIKIHSICQYLNAQMEVRHCVKWAFGFGCCCNQYYSLILLNNKPFFFVSALLHLGNDNVGQRIQPKQFNISIGAGDVNSVPSKFSKPIVRERFIHPPDHSQIRLSQWNLPRRHLRPLNSLWGEIWTFSANRKSHENGNVAPRNAARFPPNQIKKYFLRTNTTDKEETFDIVNGCV